MPGSSTYVQGKIAGLAQSRGGEFKLRKITSGDLGLGALSLGLTHQRKLRRILPERGWVIGEVFKGARAGSLPRKSLPELSIKGGSLRGIYRDCRSCWGRRKSALAA